MLKFKVHTEGMDALKSKLTEASTLAEHIVALQVKKDTAPYVPALTGTLDRTTKVKGRFIIYDQPYAHYLYQGKLYVDPDTGSSYAPYGATKVATNKDLVFSKAMHGQAQSHWFEASKAQNLDKWVRVAGRAVDSGL